MVLGVPILIHFRVKCHRLHAVARPLNENQSLNYCLLSIKYMLGRKLDKLTV